jgi:hypothetical protein
MVADVVIVEDCSNTTMVSVWSVTLMLSNRLLYNCWLDKTCRHHRPCLVGGRDVIPDSFLRRLPTNSTATGILAKNA